MTNIFTRLELRKKLVRAVRLAIDDDPYIYYVNQSQIIFGIPYGINPADLHDKSYVFRQIFGKNAELSGDLKRFVLTIPERPMPAKIPFKLDDWQDELARFTLPIICGIDALGERVAFDLAIYPHLLIAGETGAGKSSLLRTIITSIILTKNPVNVRLILADLKRSEFGIFRNIKHVDSVSVKMNEVESVLNDVAAEMERRGDLLDEEGVTHIRKLKNVKLPHYIVAIDEVALLQGEKEIMRKIEDISSIGRSLGVHLMLSMQRPDAKVLDGKLKNNLSVRISGRQSNKTNANIVGTPGAEMIKRSERGRMIIDLDGIKRIQSPFIDEDEAKMLIEPYKDIAPKVVEEVATEETEPLFGLLYGGESD